jgi:hypothetical protein
LFLVHRPRGGELQQIAVKRRNRANAFLFRFLGLARQTAALAASGGTQDPSQESTAGG